MNQKYQKLLRINLSELRYYLIRIFGFPKLSPLNEHKKLNSVCKQSPLLPYPLKNADTSIASQDNLNFNYLRLFREALNMEVKNSVGKRNLAQIYVNLLSLF